MIDLLLMLVAFAVMLKVLMSLVKTKTEKFETASSESLPKKYKVKILGNRGEKLEFSSLQEEDIKQVIEMLVAIKKKQGRN